MIVVDIIIVLIAVGLAAFGFRQGLVASLPLAIGFAAGAFAGSRIGAWLLGEGSGSPYVALLALIGAIVLGVVAMLALDAVAGAARDKVIRGGILTTVDRIAGAVLLGALGIVLAWIIGLTALNTPELSGLRGAVQDSEVLQTVNEEVPPSESPLAVENVVDIQPELEGPEPRAGEPKVAYATGGALRRVRESVVRVEGNACGLGVSASGWVVRPRLVVTAAHVVAGQDDTMVVTEKGRSIDTVPVRYDTVNDLAVLRLDGRLKPLKRSRTVKAGTPAAVLGYSEDGEAIAEPARLGRSATVPSVDSYGNGPQLRRLTSFRGEVVPGLSGAPLVDAEGRVLATVFGTLAAEGPPAGLAVPDGVLTRSLRTASNRADTGECSG